MPKIGTRGNLPSKDKRSQSFRQIPLNLQTNGTTLHSVEAPNQGDLQHHQRPAMGQTPETNQIQSFAFWVGGILFLPRLQNAPNCPLLDSPKVPGGARLVRLTQRVYPYSQSSLRTTKHSTFSKITLDRPIQGDRLTIQVPNYKVYFLPFLILYTPHLNKLLFYASNHRSTSIHGSTSIYCSPSIHMLR